MDRIGEAVCRDVRGRIEGEARRLKTETRATITDLEDLLDSLPVDARAAATRIFAVSTSVGRLVAPPEMNEWITKQFGSVDAVTEQTIVRVTNLVMLEGALFNEMRALRPSEVKGTDEVRQTIERSRGDPFCHPETGTPAARQVLGKAFCIALVSPSRLASSTSTRDTACSVRPVPAFATSGSRS